MPAQPHLAHWPTGLPRSLDYPPVAVGAIMAGAARRYGDRTAFHYAGRDLSFAQLRRRATALATALAERGVGRGDVVAVQMPNCPQYPVVYYGILLAGAVFSPCNPRLPAPELAWQLADCGAVAAVTYGEHAATLASVLHRTGVRLVVATDAAQAHDPAVRVDLTALLGGAVAGGDSGAGAGAGAAGTGSGAGPGGDAGADTGRAGTARPAVEDLEALIAASSDGPLRPPAVELDPARDLAHITYTGGTTGRSKGVELPHRNIVTNALQFACWSYGALPRVDEHGGLVIEHIGPTGGAGDEWRIPLGTGITINVTPWFHTMGTISALSLPMLAGVTTVIHDGFDPAAYLADAEKFRVTAISGAPPLFALLLAHPEIETRDLSTVRSFISGAAPLSGELLAELRRRFPDAVVGEAYGLTEASMGVAFGPMTRSGLRKQGSVGLPVFDTEVKIIPLDGDGGAGDSTADGDNGAISRGASGASGPGAAGATTPLPPGTPGEVCIRGPQVMAGYHNRPAETAAVLVDGWLHTGDIGILDEDGFLSIVDRKKDVLLYKGYNVYPRELEELLAAQPGVAAAAVVGRPDPIAGELPVAFVVRARGGGDVTAEGLMAAVNDHVVHYKRLREVHFVDQLPISAAGKVLKRELSRRLT